MFFLLPFILVSSLPFLFPEVLWVDYLEQARFHTTIGFVLCAIVLLCCRKRLVAAAIIGVAAANLIWISGTYQLPPQQNLLKPISVLTFNAWHKNTQQDRIVHLVRERKPDMIWLQELHTATRHQLQQQLKGTHPFVYPDTHIKNVPQTSMLLSRYPFEVVTEPGGYKNLPMLHVQLDIAAQSVDFIGLHLQSPRSSLKLVTRQQQLSKLLEYVLVQSQDRPIIIAGDFNTVPWQQRIRSLSTETNIRPTVFSLTWPSHKPRPFRIPIDQVMTNVCHHQSKIIPSYDSDHFPIISLLQPC